RQNSSRQTTNRRGGAGRKKRIQHRCESVHGRSARKAQRMTRRQNICRDRTPELSSLFPPPGLESDRLPEKRPESKANSGAIPRGGLFNHAGRFRTTRSDARGGLRLY